MIEIFSDHTMRIVFWGSLILGSTAGSLGAYAVLRQQSLLGDAISHATLPGVCLAFMITQTKNPVFLLIGAGIAGWLGTIFIHIITTHTKLKKDAALGIVLSVFFGFGLVLITMIQKLPSASKAGIDKFLFGSAATLLQEDVKIMAIISAIVFAFVLLLWKEFKVVVFDRDFANSQGINVHIIDILLTTLIVISIVIGLQTVGVVLMSALLVAPAAAARQWTDRLSVMVLLAAIFGAISGIGGAITSSLVSKMPTGPTIVLFVSAFVFVSLLFAPHRGLLWDWIRTYRQRKKIQTTAMLKNLLLFSESRTDPFHAHDLAALNAIGRGAINKTMEELSRKGLAIQSEPHIWALTPQGLRVAKKLTKEFEEQFEFGKET